MSAINDGEDDHPVGGRPPKGDSRDGEEFVANSQQMQEVLNKGLSRKDDTIRKEATMDHEEFYEPSQKEQDYFQPSFSSRAFSKPFTADFEPYSRDQSSYSRDQPSYSRDQPSYSRDQPSYPRDFRYSHPPPSYSREFQGPGGQFSYDHPGSRAFYSKPRGSGFAGPAEYASRYDSQWQAPISNMNSFQIMENRIADMEKRQREFLNSGKM